MYIYDMYDTLIQNYKETYWTQQHTGSYKNFYPTLLSQNPHYRNTFQRS